jgi:hypothetical protein
MAAPLDNSNARKHGGRSAFPICKLPRGHGFIDRDVAGLRRRLIDAVVERHGELTMAADSKVGLAVGHEQGRQFIAKAMRDNPKSTLSEKVAARAYLDDAAQKRDKAIESLKLDKVTVASIVQDPWDALHATPHVAATRLPAQPAADSSSSGEAPQNANGATTQLGGDYD